MILLLLLLAAPERVTVVAKKTDRPSLWHKAGEKLGAAWHRIYEKEDAQVGRGNALAAQNDAQGALKEYDGARERLAEHPALAFDRASALLKLPDPTAPAQAASEAAQALQHGEGKLKAQAAYDLALATEAMGRPDDAIKAYSTALGLDPDDPDAKVNLELLLKSQEERKQKQQLGQPQPNKPQQNQDQQKPDQSKGDEPQKQEQKQAGEQEQKEEQPQQQAKEQEKKQAEAEEKPVDRSEAERLLDALRAGEKTLQTWRFAKDKRKEARRGEPEKDW